MSAVFPVWTALLSPAKPICHFCVLVPILHPLLSVSMLKHVLKITCIVWFIAEMSSKPDRGRFSSGRHVLSFVTLSGRRNAACWGLGASCYLFSLLILDLTAIKSSVSRSHHSCVVTHTHISVVFNRVCWNSLPLILVSVESLRQTAQFPQKRRIFITLQLIVKTLRVFVFRGSLESLYQTMSLFVVLIEDALVFIYCVFDIL